MKWKTLPVVLWRLFHGCCPKHTVNSRAPPPHPNLRSRKSLLLLPEFSLEALAVLHSNNPCDSAPSFPLPSHLHSLVPRLLPKLCPYCPLCLAFHRSHLVNPIPAGSLLLRRHTGMSSSPPGNGSTDSLSMLSQLQCRNGKLIQ